MLFYNLVIMLCCFILIGVFDIGGGWCFIGIRVGWWVYGVVI